MPVEIINGVRVNRRDLGRYPGTERDADDATRLTQGDIDAARVEAQEAAVSNLAHMVDEGVDPEVVEAIRAVIEASADEVADTAAYVAALLSQDATAADAEADAEAEADAPTEAEPETPTRSRSRKGSSR
ncbi:hypothetical protein [Nocardioides sp.]|uniref:hypothetical protein n=1 Tax=Nocardioides sp. TaxID=35761 RepID=UPI0039E39087